VRGDKEIIEACKQFVLLRMTYMRDVNIGLFEYDYDMTWMSFFLDEEGRVYSRYGSRDSTSADSHNTSAGLLNTMREVLAVHKEELAKPRPPYVMPKMKPADMPAYRNTFGNSCGRCHQLNEAKWEQARLDKSMKDGPFFIYPLPDNIGIKLDLTKGNRVRQISEGSFAEKAGMRLGDVIRFANGVRVLTCADMQHVLQRLEPESKLTLDLERGGRSVQTTLELSGNWRASDVSWRKSIRMRSWSNNLTRFMAPLSANEKSVLGIDPQDLAFRLNDAKGEVQQAGLAKNDVIVAFDGKQRVPYRNPIYYPLIEHKAGDTMDVTVLRDGQRMTMSVRIP
jgi:hypothetical protein